MKIKSIHFQDVGPLGNQPISLVNDWDDSLEPRVLFSGPNGCGKSTVLRAVAMLWEALGYWLDHRKPLPKSHVLAISQKVYSLSRQLHQTAGQNAHFLHFLSRWRPTPPLRHNGWRTIARESNHMAQTTTDTAASTVSGAVV